MNPSLAQPAPLKSMPGAQIPQSAPLIAGPIPIRREMMQNIPVKNQAPVHNPIAAASPAAAPHQADKAFDVILKDVTKAVKNPPSKPAQFVPAVKEKTRGRSIAMPVTAAVLIACVLAAAAYYSFSGRQINIFG